MTQLSGTVRHPTDRMSSRSDNGEGTPPYKKYRARKRLRKPQMLEPTSPARQPAPGRHRIQPRGQFRVLRGDARRIAAFLPIVIGARRGAERVVFRFQRRIVSSLTDSSAASRATGRPLSRT